MAFSSGRDLTEAEQMQIAQAMSIAEEQVRLEEEELMAIALAVSRCVLDDGDSALLHQQPMPPTQQEQLEVELALAVSGADYQEQYSVYIEHLFTAATSALDGIFPHTLITPLSEALLSFIPILTPFLSDQPQLFHIQFQGIYSTHPMEALPEEHRGFLGNYQPVNQNPQQHLNPHQHQNLAYNAEVPPVYHWTQDGLPDDGLPAIYKNYRTVNTQFSEDHFWPPEAIMRQKYELQLYRGQEEIRPWQNGEPENDRCVICWSNVATRVAVPCGHKLGCRICIDKIIHDVSEYCVTGPNGEVIPTDRQVPKQCFICRSIIGLIVVLH